MCVAPKFVVTNLAPKKKGGSKPTNNTSNSRDLTNPPHWRHICNLQEKQTLRDREIETKIENTYKRRSNVFRSGSRAGPRRPRGPDDEDRA